MSFFDKSVAEAIRVINEMVAEQEELLNEWLLENPQFHIYAPEYTKKKSELQLEAWDRFYVIIGLWHLNSDEIDAIESGAADYWNRREYGYDGYIAYNKVKLFRPIAESMCSIYEFIRDMKDTFGKFLNFD